LGSGELVAGSLREFFGDAGIIRATDNKVLIARSNLEVGQPLTRNNIDTIELPRERMPLNVVTWHELDRVSGQKLRVERLKGDLILWSCFN
jgi:Flp pilus assembly protein CpaB